MGWLLFLLTTTGGVSETNDIYPVSAVYDLKALGKPQQTAEWKMLPRIRICPDSGVSITRATRAIKYWEKLGYEFGAIVGDPFSMCMTPKHGEILITIPDGDFNNNHMAATRLYTGIESGDIVRAKIQMLPHNAHKDRVLEHEIGHALGWQHYRQRYHIMHPEWRYGGYDSYGIRK